MGTKDQSQDMAKQRREQPKPTPPGSKHDKAWERTMQGDELDRPTEEMMREAEDKLHQDYRD
ncbi:hypothetical protein SLUN_16315 [Streptomyces lunaelactis]|uniref:Uncharacterized protein n=1 Tax=Streptomyces lunaelactis TaxID=1535768 RepID=A0A2R4T319_9ACTN|nr:hypothetical protein [Streptomyces lunaelactis]AVZ73512.1 hypothetical protein SLUN_16315 [Streptomyces lunaelactis]NUK06378.1 hypothetical protein [Streptomyces lunaelactis]NUK13374.1 hypothetical protein [Streptomyces lunaelactis]NUK21046.1 hypothetical protein [Streptomyces lunaelactis]NUK28468.1 hypothetical protein [Streptomyces lunaelactis]